MLSPVFCLYVFLLLCLLCLLCLLWFCLLWLELGLVEHHVR